MSETVSAFQYESNTTMSEMASRIREAQRIMITTHAKPDGDALGSVLALGRALTGLGKQADVYLMGPIEPALGQIAGQTPLNLVEETMPGDDYDLVILADTGSWAQVEPLADWLKARPDRIIGFDHHAEGQDVAGQRIVDTSKASATELLIELMDELGVELNGEVNGIAEALFVGLATDTGWFKFQNADAETFEVAARLLRVGVDKSRLFQIIEETSQPTRLALQGRALQSLQFLDEGRIAIMSLSILDFQETGGSKEELYGFVNIPMQIGTVRVSILLTQTEPELTKLSFRAKPALDGATFTDVNQLAKRFGGGGHVHAAGAKMRLNLEDACDTLRKALSP